MMKEMMKEAAVMKEGTHFKIMFLLFLLYSTGALKVLVMKEEEEEEEGVMKEMMEQAPVR